MTVTQVVAVLALGVTTLLAKSAPDDTPAAQDINEIIRQMEAQCVEAKYRGSRNPDDHTTTFQCVAAFNLECNLRRGRSEERSAEWIAAAEEHLRTQCQRIAAFQEAGMMGACPHCPSTVDSISLPPTPPDSTKSRSGSTLSPRKPSAAAPSPRSPSSRRRSSASPTTTESVRPTLRGFPGPRADLRRGGPVEPSGNPGQIGAARGGAAELWRAAEDLVDCIERKRPSLSGLETSRTGRRTRRRGSR